MEQTSPAEIVEAQEMPASPNTPSSRGGKARMQKLTKAQKRTLGKQAAKVRWAKTGDQEPASDKPHKVKTRKKRPAQKAHRDTRPQPPQGVFGIALMAAEKRLASAIEERARAAATWAVLDAEIPSLQRTIAALRNQQSPGGIENHRIRRPDGSMTSTAEYDLNSVVSDAPVPFVAQPQGPPHDPHARRIAAARVGGGAVGVDLAEQNDDEDQFLRDSPVARGEWH